MHPQEQPPIPAQAVYYVPVQAPPSAAAQPPTTEAWQTTPPWARTLEDRLTMHSVVLALIALMLLLTLIMTFVLWNRFGS